MTDPSGAALDRIEWRYTFVDLRTKARLARLPLVGADLSETIAGAADGTGDVPISDEDVRSRDPWRATQQRRTACFAQRIPIVGGRAQLPPAPAWAGVVWKRVRSGQSIKLSMSTVESYWQRRRVARDRVFSRADDATILGTLLTDAQAIPGGDLGITLDGTLYGTRTDRSIAASEGKTVLETMQSVADNAGVEWRLTPIGDGFTTPFGWRLDRAVRLGRTAVRSLRWVSAPDGRPDNELIGYEVTEDGSDVPNEETALGDGQGAQQLRFTARSADYGDDELAAGYPLLQAQTSGTADLKTLAAVKRHAYSDLAARRAAEVQLTSMTVRGDRGPTVDTYGLGDVVTARLLDPLWKEPEELSGRITDRRIQPNQPGRNEVVAMQLTPAAVG